MTPVDLAALAAAAEADGRQCVVGALIVDERGKVFVHRRGPDRRLLPGAWDIVGGHVEPGETLLGALDREVEEETGWRLRGDPHLLHVADWQTEEPTGPHRRREFDFLVEVEGDLSQPRLEWPQHTEFRWLGSAEIALLDDNQGADEGLVRRSVELALRAAEPGRATYPHAGVFVAPGVAGRLEAWRAQWDPAMAQQIAAHVTLVYPGEAGDLDELTDRLKEAAANVAPFRLRLADVHCFGAPRDGVYVAIDDIDGGWRRLRELVTRQPHTDVRPHATVVHPRTSNRGAAAWEALRGESLDLTFSVSEVVVTAFDGRRWPVVHRFSLGDGNHSVSAGPFSS